MNLFHPLFPLCNILAFENSQNLFIFIWSPIWSILVCKIPWTVHQTFLESQHPESTNMFCS